MGIALELLHRLMTIEAVERDLVRSSHVARRLSERPDVVRTLTECQADFSSLETIGIEVLPTTPMALRRVPSLCLTHGLLANDAALLAVMQETGLSHLATAEASLTHLAWFRTYAPSDLD